MGDAGIKVKARRPRRSRADVAGSGKLREPTTAELAALSVLNRATYVNNKRALDAYRDGAHGKDIEETYKLTLTRVFRLNESAQEVDEVTNEPRGYYACLPQVRKKGVRHRRHAPLNPEFCSKGTGYKGALDLFFQQHPEIEEALQTYLRTRRTALLSAPRMAVGAPEPTISAASCFKTFLFYCRQKRLHERTQEWPYLPGDKGQGALRGYYKRWKAAHPKLAALNELGEQAAKDYEVDAAVAKHQVAEAIEALLPAYGRVEIDGHLLHAIGTVVFKNKSGIPVHVDFRRLYALAARDVRTPTVFACRLCFGLRYDANDVLGLLRDVLFPPPRRNLTLDNPEYGYHDGAGFPGDEGVMPFLWGNTFQEIAWDADSAHISAGDARVIEELLKCKVAGERIGSPTARTFAEGLNRFLAAAFQVLASGTGTNPRDHARRDPEGAAVKYTVTIELLEELLDVWVRNWNAMFRPEFGDTPLGGLRKLADQGEVFLSRLGELSGEDRRHEFFPRFRRELQFSRTTHGVLLVNLYGARYSSPDLVNNAVLNAARTRWCTLYVNDQDARKGFIVPDEYPQMRIPVYVQNRALATFAHPLHWRIATSWWGIVHGKADKATRPDTMRGAAQALGQKAQSGDPQARAALSTITGEQARVESGAASSIDADIDWERAKQPVIGADEAEEAVPDPEFANAPLAAPTPAPEGGKRKRGARRSAPSVPTTAPPAMAAAGESVFPTTTGPVPLPPPRGSNLGLGL